MKILRFQCFDLIFYNKYFDWMRGNKMQMGSTLWLSPSLPSDPFAKGPRQQTQQTHLDTSDLSSLCPVEVVFGYRSDHQEATLFELLLLSSPGRRGATYCFHLVMCLICAVGGLFSHAFIYTHNSIISIQCHDINLNLLKIIFIICLSLVYIDMKIKTTK